MPLDLSNHGRHLSTARKLLGNRSSEAEDIVQQAYLEVWRNIDQMRDDQSGFITTIIHRRVSDLFRKKKFSSFDPELYEPPSDDDPVDEAIRHEECERVTQAISLLPDKSREAAELLLSGLTWEEGASTLAISLGAFKSRTRDMKERLKSLLRH